MYNEDKKEKVDALLNKMVELRSKCTKTKSKKLLKEYEIIQSQCIKELEFLIEDRTRKYNKFGNYDDLKQDGRMALYRALQTYEPDKGDFFWWANRYMKTKISREANRHSTIKIPLKHTKLIQPYKVSQLPVIVDSKMNALDNMTKDETAAFIRDTVAKLPEDQRKVIELHFELGGGNNSRRDLYSIGKICDRLNISRMSCVQLLNDAKETLKKELADLY